MSLFPRGISPDIKFFESLWTVGILHKMTLAVTIKSGNEESLRNHLSTIDTIANIYNT